MNFSALPDSTGHFGPYGGSFVPETLMYALDELKTAYAVAKDDPAFQEEFHRLLRDFVGRPTLPQKPALYFAGSCANDHRTIAERRDDRRHFRQ